MGGVVKSGRVDNDEKLGAMIPCDPSDKGAMLSSYRKMISRIRGPLATWPFVSPRYDWLLIPAVWITTVLLLAYFEYGGRNAFLYLGMHIVLNGWLSWCAYQRLRIQPAAGASSVSPFGSLRFLVLGNCAGILGGMAFLLLVYCIFLVYSSLSST